MALFSKKTETENNSALSFLDNPLIKSVALSGLKKAFEKHGIKLITIEMKPDGELNFEVYTEDMKIFRETEFNNIINNLLK